MPELRLERTSPGRAYFHDADGRAWRIYDGVFTQGSWHTSTPPDPAATHRIFVAEDGTKRVSAFAPGEDRRLIVDALARQLQRASYPGVRFEASRHEPR